MQDFNFFAGSADFKTELSESNVFDRRLQAKILKVLDIGYGGDIGFNQAIDLSSDVLSNVKFLQEKKLLGKYFEEIGQEKDTGKYVFGVEDTMRALEMGAVESLIVWEYLDINRCKLKHGTTSEVIVKYSNNEQEIDQLATSENFKVHKQMPLVEWFAAKYKKFGCTLELVTDKSEEGSQFCKGFGGIGGILRYKVDMRLFDDFLNDGDGKGEEEVNMAKEAETGEEEDTD